MSIWMAMMKPVTEPDVTSGMAASRMAASGMAASMMATWRLTMTGMASRFMSDQQRRDKILDGVEAEVKGVLPKWS
jgi:hypothetical protein